MTEIMRLKAMLEKAGIKHELQKNPWPYNGPEFKDNPAYFLYLDNEHTVYAYQLPEKEWFGQHRPIAEPRFFLSGIANSPNGALNCTPEEAFRRIQEYTQAV